MGEDIYKYVGTQIKKLRQEFGGKGVSQEELARVIGTTANTVSRWESGTYRPSLKDLHTLAKFFGVSISLFFPGMEDTRVQALMSVTGDLSNRDWEELIRYAQFRKARQALNRAKAKR